MLEQNKYDLLNINNDRNINLKILFRNPRLLFRLIFTTPSISQEYLDFLYDQGFGIIDILGEDKSLEIIESVEVTDKKLFDELNNIVINDEEISDRITTLKGMNEELSSYIPFNGILLLCFFGLVIWIPLFILFSVFSSILLLLFEVSPLLSEIFYIPWAIIAVLWMVDTFFLGLICGY